MDSYSKYEVSDCPKAKHITDFVTEIPFPAPKPRHEEATLH